MPSDPPRFIPSEFLLPREGSAVYYRDRVDGAVEVLMIAPSMEMAVQLATDLAKFYGVPLRTKGD